MVTKQAHGCIQRDNDQIPVDGGRAHEAPHLQIRSYLFFSQSFDSFEKKIAKIRNASTFPFYIETKISNTFNLLSEKLLTDFKFFRISSITIWL